MNPYVSILSFRLFPSKIEESKATTNIHTVLRSLVEARETLEM